MCITTIHFIPSRNNHQSECKKDVKSYEVIRAYSTQKFYKILKRANIIVGYRKSLLMICLLIEKKVFEIETKTMFYILTDKLTIIRINTLVQREQEYIG